MSSSLRWYGTLEWTEKFVWIWWRKTNCVLLHSRREIEFWKFKLNGCYGNQPQSFEVVFYSIDANTLLLQNKIWLSNKHIV